MSNDYVNNSALTLEKFRLLWDNSLIGLAFVDANGTFLSINSTYCEIVEYTQDEIVGRTSQEITHPTDLDHHLAMVKKLIAGELDFYIMLKKYITKTGKIIEVKIKVLAIRNNDSFSHFFVQCLLVDHNKILAMQIKETIDQLKQFIVDRGTVEKIIETKSQSKFTKFIKEYRLAGIIVASITSATVWLTSEARDIKTSLQTSNKNSIIIDAILKYHPDILRNALSSGDLTSEEISTLLNSANSSSQ